MGARGWRPYPAANPDFLVTAEFVCAIAILAAALNLDILCAPTQSAVRMGNIAQMIQRASGHDNDPTMNEWY